MATGGGVFISHITDEAPIAEALKVYLKQYFGELLPVFVSSDYSSIPTGEEWYRMILNGVVKASVVIILLSPDSVDRRWINFESGLAIGAEVKILPLTIRGFAPGEVGLPLSQLHVRTLAHELTLESLVRAVAEATDSPVLVRKDVPAFMAQLDRIEAELPVKSIMFEPVLLNITGSGPMLQFRLSNTGNRDVELIEVEVCIPKFLLVRPDWVPHQIPNIRSSESRKIGEIDHLFIWEQPFEGALDVHRYGSHKMLPRIVSPHWTPRFSDLIKIPLRSNLDIVGASAVKHKVVARGLYNKPGETALRDIPTVT